jgi:dipeptidase D
LQGGTARNALPREASALIALPADAMLQLPDLLKQIQQVLCQELSGIDDGVQLELSPEIFDQVLSQGETELWLNTLNAAPHGVFRMSQKLAGVVETSNNLGMLEVRPGLSSCNFMVRSLQDSCSIALANQIRSLFALSGTAVELSGHYPGWTPNPDSPLLALCQQVYRQDFKAESRVQVIHAGLECGIIGAKYPGLDIVSFGPTIHGAHAPGESVEIASVECCWKLLTAILAEIS